MTKTESAMKELKRYYTKRIAKNLVITLVNLAVIYIEVRILIELVRIILELR